MFLAFKQAGEHGILNLVFVLSFDSKMTPILDFTSSTIEAASLHGLLFANLHWQTCGRIKIICLVIVSKEYFIEESK